MKSESIKQVRLGLMRVMLVLLIASVLAMAQSSDVISGKLKQTEAGPVIQTAKGDVAIESDPDSAAVLQDERIAGRQIEAHGQFRDATHFRLNPFHTKPLFVVDHDGHKKHVTYWCDVCSIRTYTPGKCLCCQAETALDLKDPDKP